MLAVRTPGAPQDARENAVFDSAFPFERQGRLLRSRSISGLFSRSLHFGLQPPCLRFAVAVTGTPRKTWFAAARYALPRPPSQAAEFNALSRRNPHRTGLADLPHPALGQALMPSP